jgi:hypothetical protein
LRAEGILLMRRYVVKKTPDTINTIPTTIRANPINCLAFNPIPHFLNYLLLLVLLKVFLGDSKIDFNKKR